MTDEPKTTESVTPGYLQGVEGGESCRPGQDNPKPGPRAVGGVFGAPVEGERVVKVNRHPSTDGEPWGWVEEYVRTDPGSYYRWTTREVGVWSGREGERRARRGVAEHNEALLAEKENEE